MLSSDASTSTPVPTDVKRRTVELVQPVVRKDDLHTDGIDKLSSPGVNSNWLNWSFLMETSISASIYAYVMQGPLPHPPPAYYDADKAKICLTIARYISETNLVTIRRH